MAIIQNLEQKFKVGDEVYAKVDPEVKLIVRRFLNRIYYCRFPDEPDRKELAMFERELQYGVSDNKN